MEKKSVSLPKGKMMRLNVDQLSPDPKSPRFIDRNSEAFLQLVESFKCNGAMGTIAALQWEDEPDSYQVIYGHQRLAAAKEAGLYSLPVMVYPPDTTWAAIRRMQIDENEARSDLSIFERARFYQLFMEASGLSQSKAAEVLGIDRRLFSKRVGALSVGPKWCDRIIEYNETAPNKGKPPIHLAEVLEIGRATEESTKEKLFRMAVAGEKPIAMVKRRKELDHATTTDVGEKSTGNSPKGQFKKRTIADLQVEVGDYDHLDLSNTFLKFNTTQIHEIGAVANAVDNWIANNAPFGNGQHSRRFNGTGSKDRNGSYGVIFEAGQLLLEVRTKPDVARGVALLLGGFMTWNRCQKSA